jgi:hypothetical protein
MHQQVINIPLTIRSIPLPTKPVLQVLKKGRHERDGNNGKNKQFKILLHEGKLTKKVATVAEYPYPKRRAGNIKEKKATVVHGADTGNKRGKGSDNGNKTGNDNGLATIFLKEKIGLDKMLGIKEAGSLIIEHFGPELVANLVIEAITKYGCRKKEKKEQVGIER